MKAIQGPKGRIYLDHNPKTVCLLGMGPSIQDYMVETMTQELKRGHHDEVWAINMVANCFRSDLCFWMDDLRSQAASCPHPIVPTTKLKEAFAEHRVTPLYLAGGPRFLNLVTMIRQCGDLIPHEQYDWIVEEFKTLTNSTLGGLSFASVMQIISMFNEDRVKAIPDPSRSLAGLIEKLADIGVPVISATRHPDLVRNSFDYPVEEIANIGMAVFGKPYLNNGVAMAIGYAIWKGVKHLKIYGCDFTYPNRNFAESGRGCVEAWITLAATRDIQIYLSPHTSLLDQIGDVGIYGYATQPEIDLIRGGILKYVKQTAAPNGIYIPENSQGARNELVGQPQADSASGPARADGAVGNAAHADGRSADRASRPRHDAAAPAA